MSKLIPKKHVSLEHSLIGFGSKVISIIGNANVSLEYLWGQCNLNSTVKHSFDDLVLTLDYLFGIGVVIQNKEGLLCLK